MGPLDGIRCFANAFSTAFSPEIRHFIWVPALVSIVVVAAGLTITLSYVEDFSQYLHGLGVWPGVLDWLIEPLLYLISILISAWLFGFIAALIGSPFYGDLNLQLDADGVAPLPPWYKQIGPALGRELRKLRYTLPRLLGLLLLGFVPVINIIAPALWLGYGGWLMAVQFCDYSFENRAQPFSQTLDTLRSYRIACIGMGAGISFCLSIPLLNFVIAPIAVVAGALFMRQLRQAQST